MSIHCTIIAIICIPIVDVIVIICIVIVTIPKCLHCHLYDDDDDDDDEDDDDDNDDDDDLIESSGLVKRVASNGQKDIEEGVISASEKYYDFCLSNI